MPPIGYPGNSVSKAARAKAGGGFESAVEIIPPSNGGTGSITWTGAVAHGEILTITDSESRFGTRNEVKPLYVNLGGSKAGNALGRDTGDYFVPQALVSSDFTIGQITQPIKRDFSNGTGTSSFGGLPFILNDVQTPLIQYQERYYDFLNNAAGRNSGGALNLKTNRWWGLNITVPDALVGFQFANSFTPGESDGDIQFYVEGQVTQTATGQPSQYYGDNRPFVGRQWQSDEYVLQQSSGLGVADGHLIHTWNGQEVNKRTDNWVTRDSNAPDLMVEAHLDQISDGVGTENVIYYGYQCKDTEYNAVYIGNAETRSACTKLVRQPQTAWTPSQVAISLVETHVPLDGAYLYFRTGIRSWVSDTGVQI